MPTRQTQAGRDDKITSLTEEVNKINLRQQEVFAPALKVIQTDVKTLIQRDYLTRSEGSRLYVTKEEYETLKAKVAFHSRWGTTIATGLVLGLIALFYAILQSRILR